MLIWSKPIGGKKDLVWFMFTLAFTDKLRAVDCHYIWLTLQLQKDTSLLHLF